MQPKLEDYIPTTFPEIPDEHSAEAIEARKLIDMNVPLSAIEGDSVELGDTTRVLLPETRDAFEAMLPPVNDVMISYQSFRVYTDLQDGSPVMQKPVQRKSVTLNLRDELLANMDIIDSKPPYDEAMAQEIRSAFARMEHLSHEYKEYVLRKIDRVSDTNGAEQIIGLHKKLSPEVSAQEFLTRFDELYPQVPESDRIHAERIVVLANRKELGIGQLDIATFDQNREAMLAHFKEQTSTLADLYARVDAIDATMNLLHNELSGLSEGCQERLLPNALEKRDALDHMSIAGSSRGV